MIDGLNWRKDMLMGEKRAESEDSTTSYEDMEGHEGQPHSCQSDLIKRGVLESVRHVFRSNDAASMFDIQLLVPCASVESLK